MSGATIVIRAFGTMRVVMVGTVTGDQLSNGLLACLARGAPAVRAETTPKAQGVWKNSPIPTECELTRGRQMLATSGWAKVEGTVRAEPSSLRTPQSWAPQQRTFALQ